MKKRFPAIILALTLCLGLAAPALATEPPDTYQEAFKNVSISSVSDKNIDGDDYDAYVKQTLNLVDYDWDDDKGEEVEAPFSISGYNAITENAEITVTFSGTAKEDNSFINIYLTHYIDQGNGVYVWDSFPHNFRLANDKTFVSTLFSSEEHGGDVELKAGESVTFTIPSRYDMYGLGDDIDLSKSNVVYMLTLEKWYPDTAREVTNEFGYTQQFMTYFYENIAYKVDEAAVKQAVANASTAKPAAPSFTDVPSWFEKEVAWAVEKGITNGYGGSTTFAPNVECPHTQILTFLWRAADKPIVSAKAPITVASYYQDAVNWAYEKGLIDASFNPDALCTRAQAVQYIWQALGGQDAKTAASFSDVAADAPYAKAVSWAVEKGVTKGYGGSDTFAPDQVCNRGEIAAFLYPEVNY